ncbi:YuzL family protein [Bacillus tuaregi]|nr:YuzL family protein [Bacillus tuaregi]
MVKRGKNPSRAAVSAASVKGNAGPGYEAEAQGRDKVNSQNNQYKR